MADEKEPMQQVSEESPSPSQAEIDQAKSNPGGNTPPENETEEQKRVRQRAEQDARRREEELQREQDKEQKRAEQEQHRMEQQQKQAEAYKNRNMKE